MGGTVKVGFFPTCLPLRRSTRHYRTPVHPPTLMSLAVRPSGHPISHCPTIPTPPYILHVILRLQPTLTSYTYMPHSHPILTAYTRPPNVRQTTADQTDHAAISNVVDKLVSGDGSKEQAAIVLASGLPPVASKAAALTMPLVEKVRTRC